MWSTRTINHHKFSVFWLETTHTSWTLTPSSNCSNWFSSTHPKTFYLKIWKYIFITASHRHMAATESNTKSKRDDSIHIHYVQEYGSWTMLTENLFVVWIRMAILNGMNISMDSFSFNWWYHIFFQKMGLACAHHGDQNTHKYGVTYIQDTRMCPDQLWGPPSLLYDGYWVALSLGVKRARGMMLTTQPPLMPRLRKSWSYISIHPSASMACSGISLPLYTLAYIKSSDSHLQLFLYCREMQVT
jgi:hypothetical protein